MPCSENELLVIKKRLAEAELAYHNLNIGGMARVIVDQNGERVEFTAANRANLYSYILSLRALLPVEITDCTTALPRTGAFGFFF